MLSQRTKDNAALAERKERSPKSKRLPRLRLLCDGAVKEEYSLRRKRFLIGRSGDSDLSLASRYISRYHLLLVRHNGLTFLIDLDSTNGTFVNSTRVYNHVLADGDVITIDRQSVYVRYSVEYCEPFATVHEASDSFASSADIIKQALADIEHLTGKGDTDLLPALREDVPTELGFIDDR